MALEMVQKQLSFLFIYHSIYLFQEENSDSAVSAVAGVFGRQLLVLFFLVVRTLKR